MRKCAVLAPVIAVSYPGITLAAVLNYVVIWRQDVDGGRRWRLGVAFYLSSEALKERDLDSELVKELTVSMKARVGGGRVRIPLWSSWRETIADKAASCVIGGFG